MKEVFFIVALKIVEITLLIVLDKSLLDLKKNLEMRLKKEKHYLQMIFIRGLELGEINKLPVWLIPYPVL